MTYTISTDKARLDMDLIHRFLHDESYWAKNIPRDLVVRSISNSLCFGAYADDTQVGFARVVTDYAVFAYIADVFVVSTHRSRGVSKLLMETIRSHPDLRPLRRWHLVTSDAHGLYRRVGFSALAEPGKHMEIVVKDAYS